MERYYSSREVAEAAGLPYPTLMRWHQAGIVLRRGPERPQPGGGLLWSQRALQEARIAAGLRDYISRAEGPIFEIMQAVQALSELPSDPALHLDALGRPHVVEYDPESDDLQLYAPPEVRRAWAQRTTPKQRWLDQEEVREMDEGGSGRGRVEEKHPDLFEGLL